MKFKKLDIFILIPIMILGFVLRTYRIHEPLADWHSWRQSDTASVAREYVKHGIDLLHPKYQDLSSIPSGKDNLEGYRFVEFPIINALHAYLYKTFPSLGFVEWGRLLTIIASTLTIATVYALSLTSNRLTATFSALTFAILPYNIFYGRVILPEPFLVLFGMSFLVFARMWITERKPYLFILSLLSFSLSLLMKPTALILVLPFLSMVVYSWKKTTKPQKLLSIVLLMLSLVPIALWRIYIKNFPEGIPASAWLFNGNNIRFKGAFFRWIFGERIGKMILGYWGLTFVGASVFFIKIKREFDGFLLSMILGSMAYLFIIATGNVQHDYYQIQIMPTVALAYGFGVSNLISIKKGIGKILNTSIVLGFTVLSLALSWYEIRGYFNINNPAIVHAGQKIDEITPQDALVIAPYMGDTAFLFQTNRRGWPIGGDIDLKITKGASYYVTTTKDKEYEDLKQRYEVVFENDEFSIIKLAKQAVPNKKDSDQR